MMASRAGSTCPLPRRRCRVGGWSGRDTANPALSEQAADCHHLPCGDQRAGDAGPCLGGLCRLHRPDDGGSLSGVAFPSTGRRMMAGGRVSRLNVEEIRGLKGQLVTFRLLPGAPGAPVVTGRVLGMIEAADGLVVTVEPQDAPGKRLTVHHHHIGSATPA